MPCKISIVGKYFFSLSLFNYFLHILLPFSFSLRTIFFIIVMTNLPMCRGEIIKSLHKVKTTLLIHKTTTLFSESTPLFHQTAVLIYLFSVTKQFKCLGYIFIHWHYRRNLCVNRVDTMNIFQGSISFCFFCCLLKIILYLCHRIRSLKVACSASMPTER